MVGPSAGPISLSLPELCTLCAHHMRWFRAPALSLILPLSRLRPSVLVQQMLPPDLQQHAAAAPAALPSATAALPHQRHTTSATRASRLPYISLNMLPQAQPTSLPASCLPQRHRLSSTAVCAKLPSLWSILLWTLFKRVSSESSKALPSAKVNKDKDRRHWFCSRVSGWRS